MANNCYMHSSIVSIGSCRYCGRYLCSECGQLREGYISCRDNDGCLEYQEAFPNNNSKAHSKERSDIVPEPNTASRSQPASHGFEARLMNMDMRLKSITVLGFWLLVVIDAIILPKAGIFFVAIALYISGTAINPTRWYDPRQGASHKKFFKNTGIVIFFFAIIALLNIIGRP